MAENTNVGLSFHDESAIVKTINIPVSFHLLSPPTDVPYPVILLFGDVHEPDHEEESPNWLEIEETHPNLLQNRNKISELAVERNCYSLIDPSYRFFKLFVPYVNREDGKEIDVYTESFDQPSGIFYSQSDEWPIQKFIKGAWECHRPKGKSREEKCPVPELRWHFGDPRFSHASDGKYSLEFEMNYSSIEYLTKWLYGYFKGMNTSKMIKPQKLRHVSRVRKILRSLFVNGKLDTAGFAKTFIDESIALGNQSLIGKQIQKSSLSMDMIYQLIKTLIDYTITVEMKKQSERFNGINLNYFFSEYYFPYANEYPNIEAIQTDGASMFESFFSFLVDAYTLLRIFKKDHTSLLSIGYFGKSHTDSIAHALKKVLGYKPIWESNNNEVVRYVSIPQKINMDEIIHSTWVRKKGVKNGGGSRRRAKKNVTRRKKH